MTENRVVKEKNKSLQELDKKTFISTLSHFNTTEMSLLMAWIYGKAPNTQRYCRRILKDFFAHFPKTNLDQFNIGHISLYLNKHRHLKPGSRNLILATLSSLFKFLELRKHIAENPCLGLKQEKIPERWHSKVLSDEDITEMVRREPLERNKIILRLLYLTGVRRSEVNKIQKRDFVLRADGKIQMTVVGKGSKVRSLLIPQSLWKDLLSYMFINKVNEDNDYVFASPKNLNQPLSDQQVYVLVKKAAERIGKKASAHWLRHSSATHAIEKGAPLHVVQKTLGHSSLATTGKYLEARPNQSNSSFLDDIE